MSASEKEPEKIAGFEIAAPLGKGGMGAVYRARQVALDRWVALKVLPAELSQQADFVERFRAEARAAARLDHPNIVRVLEAGEAEGRYYFAMELVEGQSCAQRLRQIGPLTERDTLGIGMCVAAALGYGWSEARLIHRDVKPDNILIRSRDGEVKLADLGLAKSVAEVSAGSSLTTPGMVVGTLHYISPEQAQGQTDIDFRTDIYSLGATLFHLIAGLPPFHGDNGVGLIVKHITTPFPDIRTLREDVSEGFCIVLGKMTAKNRDERYASWGEVFEDLNAVLHGLPPPSFDRPAWASSAAIAAQKTPTHAPAKVPVEKSLDARLLAGITATVLVLAAGIWFAAKPKPQLQPPAPSPAHSAAATPPPPAPVLVPLTDAQTQNILAELSRGIAVSLFDGKSFIGWSRGGRGWTIAEGTLAAVSNDLNAQRQLGRDLPLDDFVLSWTMRVADKAKAGVDFRSQKGHLYTLLQDADGAVKLQRWQSGAGDTLLAQPASLPKNQWHAFRLLARADQLAVECNGEPLFTALPAPPFGRQLTLWVIGGRAEFRDLLLRAAPTDATAR